MRAIRPPRIRATPPGQTDASEPLLLKGVRPGVTDLWVWKTDGSSNHRLIRVEKLGPLDLPSALARALSPLEEAEVIYAGTGVILRGTLRTFAESARIQALTETFPKEVQNHTELASELLDEGERRLARWLKESGHEKRLQLQRQDGQLRVSQVPGQGLEGPAELARLQRKIHALFPATRISLSTLPDEAPTVHFRVYLLELKRSRFGAFGLSWPALQEGAFRVTSAGVQDLLQLDLTLHALEGEGSVRVLSKPELVVRAPGEAELFSGGELPIQMQNRFYSNVTWKNYGLTLKLGVTQATSDRVRLEVFTEASHLDTATGVNQIPGIQANRMKTQVDARFGKPLLLSGLLQERLREQAQGLPWLRRIPIFGSLFGSEESTSERSELVAVLLPSLAPPQAPREAELDRRFRNRDWPEGPVPPPRQWLGPLEERRLRESRNFPWNAFLPMPAREDTGETL